MRRWKVHGLRFMAFGLVAFAVMGAVTTGLWNLLMPAIFGLPAIGFWQALGLLLLGRILFGGFRGSWRGCSRGGRGPRFVNGLKDLTPEERERFRQALGRGCGKGDDMESPARA
jgi:hypothetical protein